MHIYAWDMGIIVQYPSFPKSTVLPIDRPTPPTLTTEILLLKSNL